MGDGVGDYGTSKVIVKVTMFDNYTENDTASTAAKSAKVDFNSGTSRPLLQRNLRRRKRTLALSSTIPVIERHSATNESISIWKAVDKAADLAMVDVAPLKQTPFLKRNICLPKAPSRTGIRIASANAKRNDTVDSMNNRRQYRVHCVKYETHEKIKKNTIMASFLCPAYQCPICVSYESVRNKCHTILLTLCLSSALSLLSSSLISKLCGSTVPYFMVRRPFSILSKQRIRR